LKEQKTLCRRVAGSFAINSREAQGVMGISKTFLSPQRPLTVACLLKGEKTFGNI